MNGLNVYWSKATKEWKWFSMFIYRVLFEHYYVLILVLGIKSQNLLNGRG